MKLKIIIATVGVWVLPLSAVAFTDTDDYQWQDSVESLWEAGVVSGYEDFSFRPQREVNRAEFLKMVMEALELPVSGDKKCFKDLNGQWFAAYVCGAKELGIVSGYSDGRFWGERSVSQPEVLKILFRALEEEPDDLGGEWFERYFNHAELLGMYYFDARSPEDHLVTRGEASYLVNWLVFGSEDQIEIEAFYDQRYESEIEYHTLNPAECFAGEVYDKEAQVCVLDCSFEQECLDIKVRILGRFEDYLTNASAGHEDLLEVDLVRARYDVVDEEIVLEEGEDSDEAREIWAYFQRIFPASEWAMLSGFWIFSDGYGGTTAVVIQDPTDLEKWILLVDPADSHADGELDKVELVYTLVHEFGHLLSLNVEQVELIGEDDCEGTYFTGEGCSRADSYINLFYEEFWTGGDFGFVTEYAATNAAEDFAESFAFFVLGEEALNEKVEFFYGFKELVKLRDLIRMKI